MAEWFDSSNEETIKQYLERKYPNKEYIYIVDKKKYTFADKEVIWDKILFNYGVGCQNSCSFSFINTNDLTELVKQLNENNWEDPEFMKKFGVAVDNRRRERIKKGRPRWVDENDWQVFVKAEEDSSNKRIYVILDNLANQILVRCVIVANRLTHGIDKESEENIMSIGSIFQNCYKIPDPRAIEKNNRQLLEQKSQQALNYDLDLLKRLQDLPYLNPKYKLTPEGMKAIQELQNRLQKKVEKIKKLGERNLVLIRENESIKTSEADKLSKIARLEAKISELELAKSTISQQTQTEFQTQDKSTQTDLSHQDISKLEQQNQQLKNLLQATEIELTNTKNQLQTFQTKNTGQTQEIQQLESKLKLLEQQKTTYQTKYDNSIAFIKEIREDIAKNT